MERFLQFLRELGRMLREAAATLRQALRSRYVRELEREVERLRAENRALINSLLGTAGIAPVRYDPAAEAPREPRLAPTRRRSWQQIGRMLEIEEARRARQFREQRDDAAAAERAPKPNGKPGAGM